MPSAGNLFREINFFDPCFVGRLDASNTINDIAAGPPRIHDVIDLTVGICDASVLLGADAVMFADHISPEHNVHIPLQGKQYYIHSESVHYNHIVNDTHLIVEKIHDKRLAVLGKVLTATSQKELFTKAANDIIHLRCSENHATVHTTFTLIGGGACTRLKESLLYELNALQDYSPISFLGNIALEIFED